MNDIIGQALIDYFEGRYTEDLITETTISDEDELPLPYLFRTFEEMPEIEQTALHRAKGSVLDVGCGAGNHALWLQEHDFHVTGIDTSKGAVKVSSARGVKNVSNRSLLDYNETTFDTVMLLMNGTGIFESVEETATYLQHLKTLLNPKGQILIDSSDLKYMYDRSEEGGIWVPADRYYGELEFTVSYKGQQSEAFPWLYLDERLFEDLAKENGFNFEVLARGTNFDYLARLF